MMKNLLQCSSLILLYQLASVVGRVTAVDASGNEEAQTYRLRGKQYDNLHSTTNSIIIGGDATQDVKTFRSLSLEDDNSFMQPSLEEEDNTFILSQPLAFQIVTSIILSIVATAQITLFITFVVHRSKRALEFAQPLYVCMFIAAGVVVTAACYLFIYITNFGCALREPLIFLSLSLMGATIAGRAWRISTLMSNPFMNSSRDSLEDKVPFVERGRQFVLQAISTLSGCYYSALSLRRSNKRGSPGGRVQITSSQMMKAITLLCVPQIVMQTIIIGVPTLRSGKTISYSENYGVIIGQYQCANSAAGSWPIYFSVLFAILPYACAYVLNLRPKVELETLPEIIDEYNQLRRAFGIFSRVLVVTSPIIGLTYYYPAPAIRSYASICAILGLSLSLSYHIAFIKLRAAGIVTSERENVTQKKRAAFAFNSNEGGVNGRNSAAHAVKMAEMYSKIGRNEETLELIDETLDIWKGKGNNGGMFGNQNDRVEISAGFTKNDLKSLEPDELEMILALLIIKGDTLMKLHGAAGFPMSAEVNINAMKIFELCPAAPKMKNISILFPVYNRVGVQLKGGVIDQDDACSLEMDLAERFCHEAQVQSYHFARALGNLAEWYGRTGSLDKAFRYFDIMKAVYMPTEHPPLLYAAYAVNRCAISFAVSSLWYLQKGETKRAIERCDQVIEEILPSFDTKKDMIGLYHIFWPILRVLKWSGEVDKARDFYNKWTPEGIESHFAVGSLHKPMCLLLIICDGSSVTYDIEDSDIDMVLSFDPSDMTDLNFVCDGWSAKSMAAELCLHLARRLEPGDTSREMLIDRGIQMSTVAIKRAVASNGMIKHILAYEAHKGIDDRLLALRKEDNAVSRNTIYEMSDSMSRRNAKHQLSVEGAPGSNGTDFASRFVVRGSTGSTSVASSNAKGKRTSASITSASKQSNHQISSQSRHSVE